jgi:hypothetical protein
VSCAGEQVGARSILIEPFRWANSAALAYAGSGKLCRVGFKGHTTLSRPMSMLLNRMRNEIPMDSALTKFVWPGKCYCTGVKAASILEMLNVPTAVTRLASLAQVSDQSPQTFKESMVVASKPSPGTGVASQTGTATGRRQTPVAEAAKLPSAKPQVRASLSPPSPHQTVQQPAVVQQPPLINSALIPMQRPPREAGLSESASSVAAGQQKGDVPTAGFSALAANLAQPAVAKSDSVTPSHVKQDSDPPQVASVLLSVTDTSHITTNLSNTVANITQSALLNGVPAPSLNAVSSVYASGVANTVPSVSPDVRQAAPGAEESAVPNAISGVVQSALPAEVPTSVPTIVTSAFTGVFENLASPVVPNAMADASLHAASTPVLHGTLNLSAGGEVAPKSSSVSASQANQPAATPDPSGLAPGISVPGAAWDQLVALIQPGGALPVAAQASASSGSPAAVAKPSEIASASGKDGANNAVSDTTGLKQHSQAASDQTGSQASSQGTTPSGDQSQGGSQQGQTSAPTQINLANHTIVAADQAQNAGVAAAPLQAAPTSAGLAGHTAGIPETAAPATIALPQAVPVINTAKLIQSMGQSEMRVGMRSNDFGSISISTSATRDLISAQISLDHGELARTIATHLPEMQARLGGNQAMDVRIDMNGQATGQGTRTSPGMSNGSADGSRGDRQQKGSAGSSQSADGFAGQRSSIAVAGLPSGEADARLDIRA